MASSKKLETIYYNGQPDGIRSIRRHLSTMTTYVIPRFCLSDAKKLSGINRPGIYYLISENDDNKIAQIYIPLTSADITALEEILWSELGTKEEYEKEYQDKPLGVLVREIVGLDMTSAKEAFAQYLNDVNLDDRQIYFVNQIINYIVKNGMLVDLKVLQETPFTDKGDVAEVFTDAMVWLDIMKVIKAINANAYAA